MITTSVVHASVSAIVAKREFCVKSLDCKTTSGIDFMELIDTTTENGVFI